MLDLSKIDFSLDYSNETLAGSSTLKDGWYKLSLEEVKEETLTRSGKAKGALFVFKVVEGLNAGQTFNRWFCTEALDSSMLWSQKAFVAFLGRLQRVLQLKAPESTSDFLAKPFYAYVVEKEQEYTSTEVNPETGELVKKISKNNDFKSGKLGDVVLSCEEYADKFGKAEFSFDMSAVQ